MQNKLLELLETKMSQVFFLPEVSICFSIPIGNEDWIFLSNWLFQLVKEFIRPNPDDDLICLQRQELQDDEHLEDAHQRRPHPPIEL